MRQHPTTQALLESWELALHVDKSERTIDLYLAEARRFVDWRTDHDCPAASPGDLTAVTRQDVETWIGDLRARGLAQATIRSRWIALRNFYGWALDEDEIAASPLERVKVEKPEPSPTEILDEGEITALLRACEGSTLATDGTSRSSVSCSPRACASLSVARSPARTSTSRRGSRPFATARATNPAWRASTQSRRPLSTDTAALGAATGSLVSPPSGSDTAER